MEEDIVALEGGQSVGVVFLLASGSVAHSLSVVPGCCQPSFTQHRDGECGGILILVSDTAGCYQVCHLPSHLTMTVLK